MHVLPVHNYNHVVEDLHDFFRDHDFTCFSLRRRAERNGR